MKWQPASPVTREALLLWVIEALGEEFRDHAILKGGMALRLLSSERLTNDANFVLVPYASKKDVLPGVRRALSLLRDARVEIEVHSTMIRADIALDDQRIQLECAVARECASIPMATERLADSVGKPSKIVRIMEPNVALAHKLAAWNERRLIRDLYDAYFLSTEVGARPDPATLDARLASVRSRRPEVAKVKRMSRSELVEALRRAASELSDEKVRSELEGVLVEECLAGAWLRIRTAVNQLAGSLVSSSSG